MEWMAQASSEATIEATEMVMKHIGGEQTFQSFAKGATYLFIFIIANIIMNKKIDERFAIR